MSIRVMTTVWEQSRHGGTRLLLLLAIADHAHDDGGGAYPSVESLAQKVRMSERQTHRLLRDLEASGEIAILKNAGPNRCNVYVVRVSDCQGDTSDTLEGDNLSGGGVTSVSKRVTPVTPKPSGNRHLEPSKEPSYIGAGKKNSRNSRKEDRSNDRAASTRTRPGYGDPALAGY